MKLITKAMNSPVGLRVTFETAPVEKFHISASLPDPSDSYRIDATITMPKDRQDLWLEGAVAAFRKLQRGMSRTIRLNYENVIRFFDLAQLERIDKRSADFSMCVYGFPQEAMDAMNKPKISVVSASDFARMYYGKHFKRERSQKGEETL